jgi:hypothetical protein
LVSLTKFSGMMNDDWLIEHIKKRWRIITSPTFFDF